MNKMFPSMYVQGYTAALQDVLRIITSIQADLKLHKRKQSAKTYLAIIECMIENRVILREQPNAFIRCSDNSSNGFEVYIEE